MPGGDHRHPHPELASLFDGTRSRYAYQAEGLHDLLLGHFGDEYLEERDEAWEYGYISGHLAALRWVLGSEPDFLDT